MPHTSSSTVGVNQVVPAQPTGTSAFGAVGAAAVDIVIPVYNEERALPGCLRTLHARLSRDFPFRWRIVVADNASTDGTLTVARQLAEEMPGIAVFHLDRKGRGLALRTAWGASDADVVAYMDVDLSTDLDGLLPLIAPLASGHSDLAIGSRLARGARTVRGPRREVISRCYNGIVRLTHRVAFTDAQCGFKAVRTEVLAPLLQATRDDGWFFDTELLLLADHNGLRIHEVPVDWVEDLDTRVDVVATALEDLRGLWRVARLKAAGLARVELPRRPAPAARHSDAMLPTRANLLMNSPVPTISETVVSGSPRNEAPRMLRPWMPPAALSAILLLAATLYVWSIGSLGWGNSYYAAAAKSMGTSWTNFLFGSFDPAGVVTIDKPPAALWPQVLSTKIFGVHGWALILPQAIEGVLAVLVLHRTVRRWAGEGAGLLAALILTLTPITVAINRDNNPDTLLVLLLVTAGYAFTRALQSRTGRAATVWLCLAGFLIGCGFLTKMLAAWMVIPAFAAAWLVGAAGPWTARVRRLLVAGAVLAVSSLWWVALVQWWPGDRPYIGGSEDGTAWNLVVGYNGLGRVFGSSGSGGGMPQGFGGGGFGGGAGAGRLFGDQVAGQISWLLPASAIALMVAVAGVVLRRRGRLSADALLPVSGWVLWGTWLVVCAAVFSEQQGIFHPYYTTQLAPAIGALCGGLFAGLWRMVRNGVQWAVPVGAATAVVTVLWSVVIIRRTPDWYGWLIWPVLLAGCLAVTLLVLSRRRARFVLAAAAASVVAVLLAPGAWAVNTAGSSAQAMGGTNPTAGPAVGFFGGGAQPGSQPGGGQQPSGMPSGMPGLASGGARPDQPGAAAPSDLATGVPGFPSSGQGSDQAPGRASAGRPSGGGLDTDELTAEQRRILRYAVAHAPRARIKLAVAGSAQIAAPFILGSDETVIGMGGFGGADDAPTVDQLQTWVTTGELRYVLGPDSSTGTTATFPGMTGDNVTAQRSAWIVDKCTMVPAAAYGGSQSSSSQAGGSPMGFGGGATVLYDCAAR